MTEEKQENGTKSEEAPRRRAGSQRYSVEQKLRAVRLYLEEGYPMDLVLKETGIGSSSLGTWLRQYRKEGEAGLRRKAAPRPGRRLPAAVTEKIVEVKRAHAQFGVKRIAEVLRRWFLLGVSPETVRRRLRDAGLQSPREKRARNLSRPRFFERATPNQMWQSDIFTFRLGGRYAYIVAFLDDYSRYVTGFGLYRSPTGEAVIETYRRAVGEYQPPKEMLTDRGPQYTNWRGTSRFAGVLAKDRVAHLVSRPQHPMTLGKVERFWSSLWQEFLVRAQFNSFEECDERLKLWVRYYNHRRPHQGIGGLCPADRFFEIATELKKTLQTGVAENVLELALRGEPRAPFYLVGRMEGQSVVLRAEKGKLKLSLDEKELSYDLEKGRDEQPGGVPQAAHPGAELHGAPESAGSPGRVDGTGQASGRDTGAEDQLGDAPALAATGDGGDAAGLGGPGEPLRRDGVAPAVAGVAQQAGDPAAGLAVAPGATGGPGTGAGGLSDATGETRAPAGRGDPQGPGRPDDGGPGSAAAGGVAEDLLPMGTARPGGDAPATGGPAGRPAPANPGFGEGPAAPAGGQTGAAAQAARTDGETARATPPVGALGR
jgi:transposase InsO family protein